jgi:hypothetical protein
MLFKFQIAFRQPALRVEFLMSRSLNAILQELPKVHLKSRLQKIDDRWWRFTLINKSMSDFMISSLFFLPCELLRAANQQHTHTGRAHVSCVYPDSFSSSATRWRFELNFGLMDFFYDRQSKTVSNFWERSNECIFATLYQSHKSKTVFDRSLKSKLWAAGLIMILAHVSSHDQSTCHSTISLAPPPALVEQREETTRRPCRCLILFPRALCALKIASFSRIARIAAVCSHQFRANALAAG